MFSFDKLPHLDILNARALQYLRAITAWKRYDADLMGNTGGGAGITRVRPIRSVGIIGAGVMGAEIAAAHIKHNLPVTIFDANPAVLSTIAQRTLAELTAGTDSGDHRRAAGRLLTEAHEPAQTAKCDLVIESIVEKLSVKQELFRALQKYLSPEAVVASNTSTIPIGKLAESVLSPERFCGLHFCHPVRQRPLVEIIRGAKTNDETIAALAAHAKTIDKLPIVVTDGPGFLVNRLLLPYLTEALELLVEGASIEMMERSALEFGMSKGPFGLMDEIGLDTTLQAGWSMAGAFPDRVCASPLLVAMIKSGRLGQKSGAGFFSYNDPPSDAKSAEPDPAAIEIIARWINTSNNHSPEDIILKLLSPMISEAVRIVQEKKVRDPRDIDLGSVFGLGFPARRGGLLWWANTIKPAMPVAVLKALEPIVAGLQPAPLLLDLAGQGDSFTATFSP